MLGIPEDYGGSVYEFNCIEDGVEEERYNFCGGDGK